MREGGGTHASRLFLLPPPYGSEESAESSSAFAISGIVALLLVAAVQMRPLLSSLATTKVSNAVTSIVSEAVYEAIENGELQYDGLVT